MFLEQKKKEIHNFISGDQLSYRENLIFFLIPSIDNMLHLGEVVLMSTHNLCFGAKNKKSSIPLVVINFPIERI